MSQMPPDPRQQKPSDGKVEGYSRVVNGKVVQVTGYAKKATASTSAAKTARALPGRPRMAAQPGSYTHGRDIPMSKRRSEKETEGAEIIDFPTNIDPPTAS